MTTELPTRRDNGMNLMIKAIIHTCSNQITSDGVPHARYAPIWDAIDFDRLYELAKEQFRRDREWTAARAVTGVDDEG
jgi:hypothetical protein